jgi:hypothetical protein
LRSLLWACALVLVAVSAYGFLAQRMRVSEIDDPPRIYQIVITDANASDAYDWVTVEGCSADHGDEGVVCNLGWYGRSDRAWSRDRTTGKAVKQMPVPFRDAPRGTLLRFEAVVRDRQGKMQASASFLTTRASR